LQSGLHLCLNITVRTRRSSTLLIQHSIQLARTLPTVQRLNRCLCRSHIEEYNERTKDEGGQANIQIIDSEGRMSSLSRVGQHVLARGGLALCLAAAVPSSAAFLRNEPIGDLSNKFLHSTRSSRRTTFAMSGGAADGGGSSGGARTALAEVSSGGEFKRRESAWRNWISREKDAEHPPEADRYHLFVAYACPWAHRTLIVRALKGLEDVVSTTVVHPIWQRTRPDIEDDTHSGWVFGSDGNMLTNSEGLGGPFPPSFDGNEPDPIFNARSIRELYDKVGDTDGKYTVPILWDKKLNTIVSNESSEIIRMLNSEFNEFSKQPELDVYPEDMRKDIDAINDWVYPSINNGVYRCGFATSQAAYDKAIDELTEAFDLVETILEKQRYIAGDALTEADVRLFVTLLRFDEVYVVYFKTNTRSVADSPAILNYCRDIYQQVGVKETCNMEQIKAHYYCSHPSLNKYSIIPRGNNFVKLLEEPHDRETLV